MGRQRAAIDTADGLRADEACALLCLQYRAFQCDGGARQASPCLARSWIGGAGSVVTLFEVQQSIRVPAASYLLTCAGIGDP